MLRTRFEFRSRFDRYGLRHSSFAALLLICSSVLATNARAIPRFSLLTGTRCSACHFDPQGSGIRTPLGWETMDQTGMLHWHDASLDTVAATNTFFGGKIVPGADVRLQLVRVSSTGQEMLIPMQVSASLAYVPTKEFCAYTDINLASIEERIRGGSLYAGEADFDLALQYQPSVTLPSIRAGMIQPSIGIRQDDHTPYIRREPAIANFDLVPPYYNDPGVELTYEGTRWLTINAGFFGAYNLAKANPEIGVVKNLTDFTHPTMSARVVLWPQLLEQGINGEFGASILSNGSFRMINVFAGTGLADKATLYVEGLYATNALNRIIRNFSVMGSYQMATWLSTDWRFDWGQTELSPNLNLAWAQAFTFGFEFFVAPFVELRPEYRITQQTPLYGTPTYTGQYTAQIHVFY